MNLLLDTNIIIPLEPGSTADLEPNTDDAIALFNFSQEVGAGLFIHPEQRGDIENDTNAERRDLRKKLLLKYRVLQSPPPLSERVSLAGNHPVSGSHSWIDANLVAALEARAIDYLVSEDRGLWRICSKLELEDRCLSIKAAINLLQSERLVVPAAPPAVRAVPAYKLRDNDPIFDGIRSDYPSFDKWLDKCKREQRQAWVVQLPGGDNYAGLAIVNHEDREWPNARNPTLKICTFKISDSALGSKLGELLLRAIFDYAFQNGFKTLFVETYRKQGALLHLLHQFGFEIAQEKVETGELVLRKRMFPVNENDEKLSANDYAKQFGPYSVQWRQVAGFVVPIEPRFCGLLFPELDQQSSLLAGIESFGNTLIKAYLCRSQIRRIRKGDVVFFYRSGDWKAIVTVGVVEKTLVTKNESEMADFLRKRTVYQLQDIASQCQKGAALGFTFRHAPICQRPILLNELVENKILAAPPQSITELTSDAFSWLQTHLS